MGKLKSLYAIFIGLLVSFGAYAQTGTIRGFVYDKDSGEPVIFTNVIIEGSDLGASTDVNGYFSINKIPTGKQNVVISSVGYERYTESVDVIEGKIINRKLYLTTANVELGTVQISAAKKEAKTKVQVSVAKITPKEIKSLPSVGGEPDLAQYIQVLPGVVFTGDQGGQLYIRGGSPIQNKVLLDGMVVYSPFHSIGLFSVFDTDVIRNADVYTGGFAANYGGRISSIMDIRTKDGNAKKLEGKVNLNPFGAKTVLSGPLKKLTNDRDAGSSSFLISAKTSYLRETSKVLYSYIDEDGLPFNYTDIYGKLSFNSGNGSKLNLFGFKFYDEVDYLGVSNLNWNNIGLGANFVLVPSGSPTLIEGYVAYTDYTINLSEPNVDRERSSGIGGFELGLDFKNFNGDSEVRYGVQVNGYSTNFKYFNAASQGFDVSDNTTEIAGYVNYKYANGLLVIEPSIRGHYYASLSEFSFEPRIGLKYNISEVLRFKAAGGLYSQNLIAGNSDRDVVNLFYGFISSPENLPNSFVDDGGETVQIESALQKATHAIAGFEYDLTERININVEGYYKKFNQLTNLNRNKVFEDTPENANRPEVFKKDFIVETGSAKGIDFVFKYTAKKIYVWAVYSLGMVDRWDGVMEYNPVFDRRHNINLLSTYTFGKDRSWEVSARWNFGSGLPFTQNAGFYEQTNFNNGVNTDYTQENGEFAYRLAGLNQGRMSNYHRLDVGLSKVYKFANKTDLKIDAGVTNFYNRENLFYIDRVTFERVNQLPFLPSFGITYNF